MNQLNAYFPVKSYFCLLVLIVLKINAFGQFNLFQEKISLSDSINKTFPREKIFVHYDRPSYKINDTLWLKGYVLDAADNVPNDSVGIAYVEIINDVNEVVKRVSAPCFWGYFFSRINLSGNDYKQGSYTLRAYTNWMKNFGDSLFFESHFKIVDPVSEQWRARVKEINFSDNHFTLTVALASQDGGALSNRVVSVKLLTKRKSVLNLQLRTDTSGSFYVDTILNVKRNGGSLSLEITDKENLRFQLPVIEKNTQSIDLQFLPEGGSFIAGKQQVLGFKTLNIYGKGVDVKGIIKDSSGMQVASFSSAFKGMGTVAFTPQLHEHYSAFLDNGMSFKLPEPKSSGSILQIINSPGADSIQLKIDMSPDFYGHSFYFSASARGLNCTRGRVSNFTKPYQLTLSKMVFPSGMVRFTLYDENFNALNERIIFIWHNDDLKLRVMPNKQSYQKRDSVAILIKAVNSHNENIRGSFSIAVIDTNQVKINPDAENLLSYMLLSADLRGEIEEPYYYFKNTGQDALEALMLTQGWVQYNWEMKAPAFEREREFSVAGTVSNILNKPVPSSNVTMFVRQGKKGMFFLDTLTDKNGTFKFHNFPYFFNDSVSMVIKALNKRGKSFGIGLEVALPSFPEYKSDRLFAPEKNILLDTAAKQLVDRYVKITEERKRNGNYLQEVVVKTRVRVTGSKNLNKDGGADQVITGDALEKVPKETLLDLLEKNIKGFKSGYPLTGPTKMLIQYLVDFSIVRFVIDGINLEDFYYATNPDEHDPYMKRPSSKTPWNDRLMFLKTYLDYFAAEDIIGVEVMKSPKYSLAYNGRYLTTEERLDPKTQMDTYTYVEVTTRLGFGPFLKKVPGEYMYKPLVPVITKAFYSPVYTSPKTDNIFPDMRATIYWNPEVTTNENGEANVSFYTSESNSSYLIILQGMDFDGGLGVLYQYLPVKKETER